MRYAIILGPLILLASNTNCGCRKQPAEITSSAPTISVNALRIQQEASSLLAAGREHEALQKYREVLALHPDLEHVRSMVDELTQRTDPRTWLEKHPTDWGAWMSIFAEMINSNMLDEAEAHLTRLPDGHEPQEYRMALDLKRQFIIVKERSQQAESTAPVKAAPSASSTVR